MSNATRSIAVDLYVFDVLMHDLVGHDRSPASFLVFLHLWRETHGRKADAAQLSLQQIAAATGLSKSAVQAAIRRLKRRKLIRLTRSHATAAPSYSLKRSWA
jgi:DNA-binding MarR family transcriptional regulator